MPKKQKQIKVKCPECFKFHPTHIPCSKTVGQHPSKPTKNRK